MRRSCTRRERGRALRAALAWEMRCARWRSIRWRRCARRAAPAANFNLHRVDRRRAMSHPAPRHVCEVKVNKCSLCESEKKLAMDTVLGFLTDGHNIDYASAGRVLIPASSTSAAPAEWRKGRGQDPHWLHVHVCIFLDLGKENLTLDGSKESLAGDAQ